MNETFEDRLEAIRETYMDLYEQERRTRSYQRRQLALDLTACVVGPFVPTVWLTGYPYRRIMRYIINR